MIFLILEIQIFDFRKISTPKKFGKKVNKVKIIRKAQKWKEIASRGREHGFFIFELKKSRKSIFRENEALI